MASSNVEYYQKQKELQDFVCEQEQRRKHLEQQLQVYCRSDERLAKLRASRLQSYWRKICEDQRRSQQRNEQILREFERIDTHLSSLSSRTERLRLLKQQYEDYIERTYPQWHQQVLQMKHRRDEPKQIQGRSNVQQFSQYTPQNQPQSVAEQMVTVASSQFVSQPDQSSHGALAVYASPTQPTQPSHVTSTPAYHKQQQPPSVSVTPIHRDPRDAQITQESAVYANFTSVSRSNTMPQYSAPHDQQPVQEQFITPQKEPPRSQHSFPSQSSGLGYKVPAEKESDAQLKVSDLQADISFSSDLPSEAMRPITVTVEKSGHIVNQQHREESPDIVSKSNSGPMEPNSADEADEDEISDFDGDSIPIDGRQAPAPVRQPVHQDDISSSDESGVPAPQAHAVLKVPTAGESRSPLPDSELTVEGVIHLMQYVESVMPEALSLEGFYRSVHPHQDPHEKIEIISKANRGEPLADADAEIVTMVILEHLTLVIRGLSAGCLLPDAILASSHSITEVQIGRVLSIEAKPLWDCLFNHFLTLIKYKVMTAKEVSAVFVPCLVIDDSDYYEKAYELLFNLLEKKSEQLMTQPTPRESGESLKSSLGGVPPLKFGSLVDSKQHSDDEDTTMITPSVPTDAPKIPLNETAAYRNLLSGTMSGQRIPSHHDNEEDDTDDDVEKQYASTLSPRTPRDLASSTVPPQPSTAITSQSRPPQQMEPLSETSSATSPVYVPTGMEKSGKSDGGSTGRSAQMTPFKRPPAAVMISSDLDSETDLDILVEKKQPAQEDDDFFDFYE